MVAVIGRAQWGAREWRGPRAHVPLTERTEFFIHWHGASSPTGTGVEMCRAVERIHMDDKGWAGVGYSWLVHNATGQAYEGRGWLLQGAHCPEHNRSGFGVYIGVGGDGTASPAALRTVRGLYDLACERTGRRLAMTWHSAHHATECPGPQLIAWVRAGMPITTPPGTSTPAPALPEDEMATPDEISAEIWGPGSSFVVPLGPGSKGELVLADGRPALSPISTLAQTLYGVQELVAAARAGRPPVDVDALADAIVARLPTGAALDPQAVARAVVVEMGAAMTSREGGA